MGPGRLLPMAAAIPSRAVALSAFGAALGSLLWVLTAIAADLERAIPAVLIGLFAGAAPRLEPHRGRITRVVAVVLTVVGLVVVQYFVLRHAVVTDLVATGRDRSIPMFLSPGSMAFVTFGWLRVYPVDALLWLVSAALAFMLPLDSTSEENTGTFG